MELIEQLGVDWKLLVAQIANFAILIGVLGYFVYKPLLDLLDARRDRIAKAMENARRVEGQTRELEQFRLEQLKKVDQEIGAMLERGKRASEAVRDRILEEAKREADAVLEKGRRHLEDERARVFHDVQASLATMIVRMTEKILDREFSDADQKRLLSNIEQEIPSLLR